MFFKPIKETGIDYAAIDKFMTTEEAFKRIYQDYKHELEASNQVIMDDLKKLKKQAEESKKKNDKNLEDQQLLYEQQKDEFFERITYNFNKFKAELKLKYAERENYFDSSLNIWKMKLMLKLWHLAGVSKKNIGIDQLNKIFQTNPMIEMILEKQKILSQTMDES